MTVQELIDKLQKIEDKTKTVWVAERYSIDVMIDDFVIEEDLYEVTLSDEEILEFVGDEPLGRKLELEEGQKLKIVDEVLKEELDFVWSNGKLESIK